MNNYKNVLLPLFVLLLLTKGVELSGGDADEGQEKSNQEGLGHNAQSSLVKTSVLMCQMLAKNENQSRQKQVTDSSSVFAMFNEVYQHIAQNCARNVNFFADIAVASEQLRKLFAKSILGDDRGEAGKPNAFLAKPFTFITGMDSLNGIRESENHRKEGSWLFTVVQSLVAKIPANMAPKRAMQRILGQNQHNNADEDKTRSHLSLSADLGLFQLAWAKLFDEQGRPTAAMLNVLRGKEGQITDSSTQPALRRGKRDANLLAYGCMGLLAIYMGSYLLKALVTLPAKIMLVHPMLGPILFALLFVVCAAIFGGR